MKGVLQSIRDLMPGKAEETRTDEPQAEVPLAPLNPASSSQPARESEPSRLVREMIQMADIEAAEAASGEDPLAGMADAAADPDLEARVMTAIKTVRDPEIPVNLVDLGLIYDFKADTAGKVFIEMTLTTPNCPSAADLPSQIEQAARGVEGVTDVRLKLVFTPPWHHGMMSEEARLDLGLM